MGEAVVVYDPVPLVALQLVRGVEEVLAHQVGVGPGFADGAADGPAKLLAELRLALPAEHVGDVDAPAVGREGRQEPATEDSVGPIVDAAAQLKAAIVELGQRPYTQPTGVIVGMFVEGEELGLQRVGVG